MKKKFIFYFFYLLFSTVFCFSNESKIIIIIKSKEITFYDVALKGFKEIIKQKNILAVFKEYNLEETDVIKKIKNEKVDLILTLGTSATKAAVENIKDLPIVFSMIYNPEQNALKAENLTGSSLDITIETQFETMKKNISKMKKIGVIYNSAENDIVIKKASKIALDMGLELIMHPVKDTKEIPKIEEMKIDVLWMVPDTLVCKQAIVQHIILDSIKNKIPVIGISPYYVKAGALMALACDYEDIGKQSGELAERILTGENISSIPVTVPRKTKLYLNLDIAETLGIKIPEESIRKAEIEVEK